MTKIISSGKRLNKEEKIELCEKYLNTNITLCELAILYGISDSTVGNIIRKSGNNIRRQSEIQRKYYLNENYFSLINSREKSYFAGLIFSDGCNYINNDKYKHSICIGLQEEDADILNKFSLSIETDKPFNYIISKNNRKNIVSLEICSLKMSDDLFKLGCVNRKSLTLRFPESIELSEIYLSDFIRGYFCGNGSINISYTKNGYLNTKSSISSTKMFCESLKNILKNKLNINSYLYIKENGITASLEISGIHQNYRFLSWMYKDTNLYIERKYSKFLQLEKIAKERA